MKRFYLAAAIVGAIVPYIFFAQQFAATGMDPYAFLSAMFANGASGGFTADLLITSVVLWVVMYTRYREGKGPSPALFIVLNLTIGVSCALPAYLYVNEERKRAQEKTV